MFTVTCDKCGQDAEVPFKPSGDKPVYCSSCFRKDGGSAGPRGSASGVDYSKQFEELGEKLDRIIELLEENGVKTSLKMMGIPDKFIEHAKPDIQKKIAGIDKDSIKKVIKECISK